MDNNMQLKNIIHEAVAKSLNENSSFKVDGKYVTINVGSEAKNNPKKVEAWVKRALKTNTVHVDEKKLTVEVASWDLIAYAVRNIF